MNVDDTIVVALRGRAGRLKTTNLSRVIDRRPFHLAGGALGRDRPNDFDLYPADGNPFDFGRIAEAARHVGGMKVVAVTKNALTAELNGQVLQFCQYVKQSLGDLVESFDFAHCQAGVTFVPASGSADCYDISGVLYTEEWLKARALESTHFTSSEYPTASLLRTFKYYRRKMFAGKSYMGDVLSIVSAIVSRGFIDYDDFKDQMDAIDLAYSDAPGAYAMFRTFADRGLVKSMAGLSPEQEKELK